MRRSLCSTFAVASILIVMLVPSLAFAETYAHGYLRYEVADQSVTITGYEGREEAVTVPAMIGGNPVNAIAAGAFADASTVVAVYLPDTVTSVEQGAFGVGQAVVFGGRAGGAAGSAGDGDASGGNEPDDAAGGDASDGSGNDTGANDASGQGAPESPSDETSGNGDSADRDGNAADSSQASPSSDSTQLPTASGNELGIRMGDGSLVTVDDEGNLVLVDADGTERVLGDSRSYTRVARPDGTVAIVDDVGDEVVVADGSKVSFSDADGRQVVVDAARGAMTASAGDGSFGYEEVEVGDDAEDSTAHAQAAGTEGKTDEQRDEGNTALIPAIAIAAAAVVIVGIVLWRRRKR